MGQHITRTEMRLHNELQHPFYILDVQIARGSHQNIGVIVLVFGDAFGPFICSVC